MSRLILTLGNQLFPIEKIKIIQKEYKNIFVFMKEDRELCTYYKFHKHKIIFFLSAMRTYQQELIENKIDVEYYELNQRPEKYEDTLLKSISKNKIKKVYFYEIEDKFFESRILNLLRNNFIDFEIWPSPMFLTSRPNFENYLKASKKPFMKVFYEAQRKRLNILLDKDQKPEGGQWSFDAENRLPLPLKIQPPEVELVRKDQITKTVCDVVDKEFSSHPGLSEQFWLPVDREGAKKWLKKFIQERLLQFGPYEDAIPEHSDFVFHSVLTPFLNCGLLTPEKIVKETLKQAKSEKLPIPSVEGFIRQVIGWREFVRGIYQNFSEKQDTSNFFKHKKKLSTHWYQGNTGIAPLDATIRKTIKYGYAHHIERLMVVGSLMLLLEIEPQCAHKWFMEMFIDSSDWVMGPNVYGMALFSDGGIFATKPYFCGSNYYRKMGGYKASECWCDGVDGLYWGFIEKNKTLFLKNPRLSMMVRTLEKMDAAKKNKIYSAANLLRKKLTIP